MARSVLLQLARDSIEEVLQSEKSIDREQLIADYPALAEKVATFVTLTIGGELRGCIGSLEAQRPLIDDIVINAKSAAFQDPRFPPVTTSEYLHAAIEVSLLTPPAPVEYTSVEALKAKIRPGIDGVILAHGGRQATFLPQVWEQLPDFEQFFAHLGLKAGLGADALRLHPEVYVYQVEKATDVPILPS